jgi:hypothetical protein
MHPFVRAAAAAGFALASAAHSATPVATWHFDNSLAAAEAGVPALTAIDPLGRSGFVMDTVFGESRWVYRFDGNRTPAEQAGLYVSTTALLDNNDAYSVDLVFQFEADQSSWENILGVSNRQSDNAFYVAPSNKLQVWPMSTGPSTFTFGEYHRATLTNKGNNRVTAYLDGVFQFDLETTSMNFSAYASANPARLIHFFADNVAGGGQQEYANGRVALIRLYDVELTATQVGDLPLPPQPAIPEPRTWALMLAGAAVVGVVTRRRSLIGADSAWTRRCGMEAAAC